MKFQSCLRSAQFGVYICVVLLPLSACAPRVFVKTFDVDNDGIAEKTYHVSQGRVVREDHDKNQDGLMDTFVHYNEGGKVSALETDTNGDGSIDQREEYFPDSRTRSLRDDDFDGQMDRSWVTYFDEQSQPVYMELDLNNDFKVDSKINMKSNIRENLVHRHWHKDVEMSGKHGVLIKGKYHEIEFKRGDWVIVS